MAGSLEKRGENSWRLTYYKGRDADNKRIKHTRNFKGDKRSAEKALAKFVHEIETGLVGDGENMLFRDLCDRWLRDYAQENLTSPKSYNDFKSIIENRLKPGLGHLKIHDVKPLVVAKFYKELKDPSKRLKKGKNNALSASTIQKYHRVLMTILNTAVRWQLIVTNPCSHVDIPKDEQIEMNVYDEKQAAALLKALESAPPRYRAMITLALKTGLRRGELLALTWDDIDFEKKTLTVNKQAQYISTVPASVKTDTRGSWSQSGFLAETTYRVRPKLSGYTFEPAYLDFNSESKALNFTGTSSNGSQYPQITISLTVNGSSAVPTTFSVSGQAVTSSGGKTIPNIALSFTSKEKGQGMVIREPKTKNSRRTISISNSVVTVMKEYKKIQSAQRLKIGDLWEGKENYIFTTWNGLLMHSVTPSFWFKTFLISHQLPVIRFHDIRHTHATLLIAKRVPLVNVSRRLGHASPTITANIYAHALTSVDQEAAEILDQALDLAADQALTQTLEQVISGELSAQN